MVIMAKKKTTIKQVMAKVTLEKIAGNLALPEAAYYDFTTFAGKMQLFDYQEQAVIKATKLLCRYFNPDVSPSSNKFLLDVYQRNSDYPLENLSVGSGDTLYPLLADYFISEEDKLDYNQFLNRMNFWMATGSGKTIVMVKLISIVAKLMQDKIIPTKPIMILAPDDSILSQILNAVNRYNIYATHKLSLVDLKQNWERDNRYIQPDYLASNYTKVYYYKSNNFVADKSDVASSKDGKNIYFDNYRNLDGWYLFLDEAHRGEDSKSKRKAIFNILAKNGFLFNFSATFTDDIDVITTIFDMNLAKFLSSGYGKKLYISETEIGDLATGINQDVLVDKEDLEKQKTIAKTVLLLALQRKNASSISQIDKNLYHMPLMLILAGQVNSEDKGLKPFFNYLIQMVKNEWNIDQAKQELKKELNSIDKEGKHTNFKFGLGDAGQIRSICNQIDELTTSDIWTHVFGGDKGNIEIITFDKNKNEVAFKLKTANQPFALLVIGDAINWLKNDVSGVFEVVNRSLDASLFDEINSSSNIAMLLGSQMFKEGWDSNRPNIVCYLGIGKNADNKKYVMQTIGRGIRIEPLPDQRKRFEYCNTDSLSIDEINQIRALAPAIETEFVFATDSKAINEIWSIIQEQGSKEDWNEEVNKYFDINKKLPRDLVLPRYKDSKTLNNNPFRTSAQNKTALKNYISPRSDKVLALSHDLNLRTINKLRSDENIKANNKINMPQFKPKYLVKSLHEHFNKREKIIADFIHLSDQIKHYKHIATTLTNGELEQLEKELVQIMQDDTNIVDENKLLEMLLAKQISTEEYAEKLLLAKQQNSQSSDYKIIKLISNIKKLFKHHYYQPIVIFEESYHDKFKHIIKVSSEIEFLTELCKYQSNLDDKYDWWYFTKVDETLDTEIGIDYFDQTVGKARKFYPDFLFWLKEKSTGSLLIKFIDPKGGEHQNNPYDKACGFEKMFSIENLTEKVKEQITDEQYQISLHFYNSDELVARSLGDEYKKYWCNSIEKIF